jgi:hypothetical protein
VLSLERLPLPQDHRLGLLESLMSAGQHPREGRRHHFWPDAGLELLPKNNLCSSGMGGEMESGALPASSAVADGIFDDIAAAVGSAVAVGGSATTGPLAGAWGPDGTASAVAAGTWGPDGAAAAAAVGTWGPDGAASVVAGETWGPDGAASAVAGGGRSPASRPAYSCCWEPDSPVGATLEAEEEEALRSKGRVNTRQHGN